MTAPTSMPDLREATRALLEALTEDDHKQGCPARYGVGSCVDECGYEARVTERIEALRLAAERTEALSPSSNNHRYDGSEYTQDVIDAVQASLQDTMGEDIGTQARRVALSLMDGNYIALTEAPALGREERLGRIGLADLDVLHALAERIERLHDNASVVAKKGNFGAKTAELCIAEADAVRGAIVELTTAREVVAALQAAALQPRAEAWRATHRHLKRGTEYQVIGCAAVQASKADLRDDAIVYVYRDVEGDLWVRGVEEFNDGRFEALPPPPEPEGFEG